MRSGSRAADPFKKSLLERQVRCKLESWGSFGESLKEERGVENDGVGLNSEEIAAMFEVWERDRGDIKKDGQLGVWILDFVYPFWMKLWLHFIQNKIRKRKKLNIIILPPCL